MCGLIEFVSKHIHLQYLGDYECQLKTSKMRGLRQSRKFLKATQ